MYSRYWAPERPRALSACARVAVRADAREGGGGDLRAVLDQKLVVAERDLVLSDF
jgi:hypothetical protein